MSEGLLLNIVRLFYCLFWVCIPAGPVALAFVAAGAGIFATLSRSTGKSAGGEDMRNSAREIGIGSCSPISESSKIPTVPGATVSGPCSRSLGGPIGLPRAATTYTSRALVPTASASTSSDTCAFIAGQFFFAR